MKTHEEIKNGLECCISDTYGCYEKCPYFNSLSNGVDCALKMHADALAYINQLEARVTKWISVKDMLPEDDDDVLIFSNERVIFVGCYKNGQWISYSLYAIYGNVVTHWMPLPSTEGLK